VYDMYPWDGADSGGRPPHAPHIPQAPQAPQARRAPRGAHANAVQVALDRRDNGGDAAATSGAPTAGPTRQ
jgi:hypothetical protein